MDYVLRKATEKDIPEVVELSALLADYHNSIDSYWKAGIETRLTFGDFVKGEIQKESSYFLVAEVDNQIVGFFAADIAPQKPITTPKNTGHISNAFLLPEYRGKGIAKKAVLEFFAWFRIKGATVAEITVDSRNLEGVRAWEGLGFKEYMKKMKFNL